MEYKLQYKCWCIRNHISYGHNAFVRFEYWIDKYNYIIVQSMHTILLWKRHNMCSQSSVRMIYHFISYSTIVRILKTPNIVYIDFLKVKHSLRLFHIPLSEWVLFIPLWLHIDCVCAVITYFLASTYCLVY